MRLVGSPEPRPDYDDPVTRECRIKRIRWLAKAYFLQPIVEQACFGLQSIYDLDRIALIALHQAVERARECPQLDVSWEEAGLIHSQFEEAI